MEVPALTEGHASSLTLFPFTLCGPLVFLFPEIVTGKEGYFSCNPDKRECMLLSGFSNALFPETPGHRPLEAVGVCGSKP